MEINSVKFNNRIAPVYKTSNPVNIKPVYRLSKPAYDAFVYSTPQQHIPAFTGNTLFEKLIIRFLENKCFRRSIFGSSRPYIRLDKDLKAITKEIQIPVTKKENINALDINPNNSDKYILFLHGFSHNITSNQPLYKELAKSDYGILAIDYRGYGKNKPSKHIKEKDIAKDVLSAYEYLKNKGVKEIGMLGHSFGGYLAAKISNIQDTSFQILVAPLLSMDFWIRKVIQHPSRHKQEMRMIRYIPKFKEQYAKIFNIKKHLEQNPTPTYVVQSEKDRYIRAQKVISMSKSIPNLKKLELIPVGGHRMDEEKINKISSIVNNL